MNGHSLLRLWSANYVHTQNFTHQKCRSPGFRLVLGSAMCDMKWKIRVGSFSGIFWFWSRLVKRGTKMPKSTSLNWDRTETWYTIPGEYTKGNDTQWNSRATYQSQKTFILKALNSDSLVVSPLVYGVTSYILTNKKETSFLCLHYFFLHRRTNKQNWDSVKFQNKDNITNICSRKKNIFRFAYPFHS